MLLTRMTKAFRAGIQTFAENDGSRLIRFERGQRKEDAAGKRLARFRRDEGHVSIGVAQEKACAFCSFQRAYGGASGRAAAVALRSSASFAVTSM